MSGNDELIAKMAKDDRLDILDLLEEGSSANSMVLMSPRDYALSRGMQPQQVYYYIRRGVIESLNCLCHRHVIDAIQADEALEERRNPKPKEDTVSTDQGPQGQ